MTTMHNHPSPAPRREGEWPSEPLPSPAAGEGGHHCNAPLMWGGKVMGHCTRWVRRDRPHRGRHRIEWDG